ncbi:hypothetical protein M378DRAFT_57221, partial [Amanita muscaria Koide BX008]
LKKKWSSGVYAFFKTDPLIEYDNNGDRLHVFECTANPCRGKGKNQRFVKRNLTTGDATSTGNLCKHAINCWGKDTVDAASKAKSLRAARDVLNKNCDNMHDRSLVGAFERVGSGKVTYSHRPPTVLESRAAHVRWMAESRRAFNLVSDEGYQHLMKSGRPAHYIPSVATLSRDVRQAFVHCRKKVAKLLQVS